MNSRIVPLILSLCAGVISAQQTRPATMPAVDLSTPRGALRALNLAMTEGDVATITRLFLAPSPSDRQMVEADAEMSAALAALRRAAATAFGEDGAKTVTGDTAGGAADSIARIEAAEINVAGDTATVVYRDEKETPFLLKKVANEWRVPVSDLGRPIDPEALARRLADLEVQRRVVLDIADEIRSGKLATAEQARETWRSRILQAATSQPTTRPAGTK